MTTEAQTPVPPAIAKSFEQAALPGLKYEGLAVDSVTVNFSGSVELDKNFDIDRRALEEMAGGSTVRLVIDAYVSRTGGNFPRNKEGELKAVDRKVSLKVHSIELDTVEATERP